MRATHAYSEACPGDLIRGAGQEVGEDTNAPGRAPPVANRGRCGPPTRTATAWWNPSTAHPLVPTLSEDLGVNERQQGLCRSYKQVSRPIWDDDSRIRSVRWLHLLLHCRASVGA
jgi:hypothetical protein